MEDVDEPRDIVRSVGGKQLRRDFGQVGENEF